jgi:hypothetical protein
VLRLLVLRRGQRMLPGIHMTWVIDLVVCNAVVRDAMIRDAVLHGVVYAMRHAVVHVRHVSGWAATAKVLGAAGKMRRRGPVREVRGGVRGEMRRGVCGHMRRSEMRRSHVRSGHMRRSTTEVRRPAATGVWSATARMSAARTWLGGKRGTGSGH